MAEDHEKIDLSYIRSQREKDLESADESVHVPKMEKNELRDIKEKIESERKEFTEEECLQVLRKAENAHMAATSFAKQTEDLEEDDKSNPLKKFYGYDAANVAPGAILGLYHDLATTYPILMNSEVDDELKKKTAYHFSEVIGELADAEITANIHEPNYGLDASVWDSKAAEAQTNHPEVDMKKARDLETYKGAK